MKINTNQVKAMFDYYDTKITKRQLGELSSLSKIKC